MAYMSFWWLGEESAMKIRADRQRCIGAGMCVLTAGGVFDQDVEDGRVLLLHERPAAGSEAAVRQAVSVCPSGALSLHDDEPGAASAA